MVKEFPGIHFEPGGKYRGAPTLKKIARRDGTMKYGGHLTGNTNNGEDGNKNESAAGVTSSTSQHELHPFARLRDICVEIVGLEAAQAEDASTANGAWVKTRQLLRDVRQNEKPLWEELCAFHNFASAGDKDIRNLKSEDLAVFKRYFELP
ncbi:unnamed protein product, partial [Amoebophrya sp. A120]|eukprot:GSA120T00011072001.1